MYVSEHRGSYGNSEELDDVILEDSDIVLFPISITRFEAMKAQEMLLEQGIKASVIHQVWIKPFVFEDNWKHLLNRSKYGGIVLDDDYVDGVGSALAHKMMLESDKKVHVMGLENKTAGFHKDVDNLPPTAEKICQQVRSIMKKG